MASHISSMLSLIAFSRLATTSSALKLYSLVLLILLPVVVDELGQAFVLTHLSKFHRGLAIELQGGRHNADRFFQTAGARTWPWLSHFNLLN